MDPDANLKELLSLCNKYAEGIDFDFLHKQEKADIDVTRMCELMLALDEWVSKGGFLPKKWEKK